jgi:glycosyltransferase involved in cell wall biosynthesis
LPKVSALTSIYKSDKYLDGYIKNVKKQKFKDFDIHIDLNKPSGNELEKLTQFSNNHERINLNVSKRLKSMSASWNTCIINSDSEYICLWNVDDKRSKNSLKIMSEVLDNNKKIDIVYGHYYKTTNYNSMFGKLVDVSGSTHLLKIGMILGPFFMFRRNLIERAGYFDEQLFSGADYDFAIRILNNGRASYIKKNLGYFLDEGLGASTRPNSKQSVERTLVELRYGIRVLDHSIIETASQEYDVENIFFNNQKFKVKQFLP